MASTKITLQPPYSSRWKAGYIVTNREGRKTVILFNSDSDRTSTQYARYVLAVKLGRFLDETEEADHIDNDKTNDDIANLQVLTVQQHRAKSDSLRTKAMVKIRCPTCGVDFLRRRGVTQVAPALKGKITCCSAMCSNKLKERKLTADERLSISASSVIEEADLIKSDRKLKCQG